eukprot:TRINITY_DN7961_c0_g1_i1.p1 TRINITY_DN7961_c0_g1~~TRINITY_DN7961_c0_g1_i1.p1  ORF type:complete len:127 (-),score=33.93 TRINITY_DN7961_c0_g1_i1:90-470(-)
MKAALVSLLVLYAVAVSSKHLIIETADRDTEEEIIEDGQDYAEKDEDKDADKDEDAVETSDTDDDTKKMKKGKDYQLGGFPWRNPFGCGGFLNPCKTLAPNNPAPTRRTTFCGGIGQGGVFCNGRR